MTAKSEHTTQRSSGDASVEGRDPIFCSLLDSSSSSSKTGGTRELTSNLRSCVTCRRKKVRCDKHSPCSNCAKVQTDCKYSPYGHAPRRPSRRHDVDLLKRLQQLESVIDSLRAHSHNGLPISACPRTAVKSSGSVLSGRSANPVPKSSIEHSLGRLIIEEDRSHYLSKDFWGTIGEEAEEFENVLDEQSSDDNDDLCSPGTDTSPSDMLQSHQDFIFGCSSMAFDMSELRPSSSQTFVLWEMYKENVDPVTKVYHVPTIKNVVTKAAIGAASLSKTDEVVLYSMCFASVVSMTEDQCLCLLQQSRKDLLQKHRFAAEQSLARAGGLNSSSLVMLQAFVLFLVVLRCMESSKTILSLGGLVMRQAQAQGLHHDGTKFRLNPFETEMRRRLWWTIVLLDLRASEDYGLDPSLNDRMFDTRMPLNVNDKDIHQTMEEPPSEQSGQSDFMFVLMRFELGNVQRRIRLTFNTTKPEDINHTLRARENLIDETHKHMEEKFFLRCVSEDGIPWVTATVGRFILAKMWLMVHHPRLNHENHNAEGDLRDRIFIASVEVVEFGGMLQQNSRLSKWGWLFRTYMQWNAVAYVLSELCVRPNSSEYRRAWEAINSVYDESHIEPLNNQLEGLWKPIKQLYFRAKARYELLSRVSLEDESSSVLTSNIISSKNQGIAKAYAPNTPFRPVTSACRSNLGSEPPLVSMAMVKEPTGTIASVKPTSALPSDDDQLSWAGYTLANNNFCVAATAPGQFWGCDMQLGGF